MKNRIIILLVAFFLFPYCKSDHAILIDQEYGAPFIMEFGEHVILPTGAKIQWVEIEDTRCPKQIQCILPGEARLTLILNDTDTLPPLKHFGNCTVDSLDCGNQISIGTDTLDLLFLYPYPDSLPYPNEAFYEARMIIERE